MQTPISYIRWKHDEFSWWKIWHITNDEITPCCGSGDVSIAATAEITSEPPKTAICQSCICAVNGYDVTRIRGGQVRRYGPTINTYTVIDLNGDRSDDEVLEFCRTHIYRAKMKGDDGFHSLLPHVMRFCRNGDGGFTYEAGHEYTG